MEDKRRSVRKFLYNYSKVFDDSTNRLAGRAINMTREGIMLMSDEPFEQDANFQFRMNLPDDIIGRDTIAFDGVCRWCRPSHDADYYDVGFEFTDLPESSVTTIDHLLRHNSFDY